MDGRLWLRRLLWFLCILFCIAYPIAVTGVAFNVQPPFSLGWAGSALLFLEGALVTCATLLNAGWRRGLPAGILIIMLSYLIEAIGANTGFPFGIYHYTNILFPLLPGHVPLAVMFAWLLVIFGSYAWLYQPTRRLPVGRILLGATLAVLLDLEIEPVAAHLEHYWQWDTLHGLTYYGVPLANFVAWFAVAALLLWLTDRLVHDGSAHRMPDSVARLVPRVLFAASLFMFGLVDLTHGYYLAVTMGLLAALLLYILPSLPQYSSLAITPAHRVQKNQALQQDGERVEQTEQ